MPTEVTATIMIGPVVKNSAHGDPAGSGERVFCPSHVMTLMEGARATWIVQRCPWWDRPVASSRIHPRSPKNLIAAGLLGYVAMSAPGALDRSERLRETIAFSACGSRTGIGVIDGDLAREVFATCDELVYGVITVMPGSSITTDELRVAREFGLRVAEFVPVSSNSACGSGGQGRQ